MSWVEKNRKINNFGGGRGGTIIRDSRVGESTEKYITFTVPVEKEFTKTDKNGEEITKNVPCILQFIEC